MSIENGQRVRVDVTDLTMREKAAAAEAAAIAGDAVTMAQAVLLQAGFAWQTIRRTDPTFTYEQALDLKDSQLEFVENPPTPDGASGITPPSSLESGDSIPVT